MDFLIGLFITLSVLWVIAFCVWLVLIIKTEIYARANYEDNCQYCSNTKGIKEPYPDIITCEDCLLKPKSFIKEKHNG